MCFDCIYQNIIETSHEWIDCKCKNDGEWHNPYCGCENHKSGNTEREEQQ